MPTISFTALNKYFYNLKIIKMILVLEQIVAEYSDPETYLQFIQCKPQIYTLCKYETFISKVLKSTQEHDISTPSERKYLDFIDIILNYMVALQITKILTPHKYVFDFENNICFRLYLIYKDIKYAVFINDEKIEFIYPETSKIYNFIPTPLWILLHKNVKSLLVTRFSF
jgi:hypothetical protein